MTVPLPSKTDWEKQPHRQLQAKAQESSLLALQRESEAAKTLIVHLKAMQIEDEETVHDTIEGETNLVEAVTEVIKAIREDEAHIAALKDYEAQLETRRKRLEGHREAIRGAIQVALSTAEQDTIKTPFGTASLGEAGQKVIVTDESLIPSKFWKPKDPVLDKTALNAAVKTLANGEKIPGVELSNGGKTLRISKS